MWIPLPFQSAKDDRLDYLESEILYLSAQLDDSEAEHQLVIEQLEKDRGKLREEINMLRDELMLQQRENEKLRAEERRRSEQYRRMELELRSELENLRRHSTQAISEKNKEIELLKEEREIFQFQMRREVAQAKSEVSPLIRSLRQEDNETKYLLRRSTGTNGALFHDASRVRSGDADLFAEDMVALRRSLLMH